jgi:hypothetical protein
VNAASKAIYQLRRLMLSGKLRKACNVRCEEMDPTPYWRVLIFLGIMFVVAITYHGVIAYQGVQRAITERNSN